MQIYLIGYDLCKKIYPLFLLHIGGGAKQLTAYLNDNNLLPCHQSVYQHFHSTEMALLRVLSDLTSAVESATFSTHSLLNELCFRY